jgi:cob(I)alamin adenosyltransferase
VARRAERAVWALLGAEPDTTNPQTATYLNRLSDLLFILARVANLEVGDVMWQPQASRRKP